MTLFFLIAALLFRYGIRCNAVLPGLTITEASAVVPADAKEYVRTEISKQGSSLDCFLNGRLR